MMFELVSSAPVSLAALLTGIAFGFLLRKGGVSRFDTIVGQLLLKDFTVMKVMFTAIVVGSFGIYSLQALGWLPYLHLSATPILFAVIGAAVFGVGMALAGYCPGTAIAALAEGSRDVWFVVAGLLSGAALFNAASLWLLPMMAQKDSTFKMTLPNLFSVSPFVVSLVLAGAWVLFALTVRQLEKGSGR